nr:RNA-binding protein 28-like [Cherax quadricarinatus]
MMKMQGKDCSVIVTQLPRDISRREVQDFFSEVAPVRKCHLVRDKNDTFKGMAYIVYTLVEDASQAVKQYDNASFKGKILKVKFSHQRQTEANKTVFGIKGDVKEEDAEENEKEDKTRGPRKKINKREPGKQRKGRIIIRNLSFKADEKLVEEHFSKYGKIREVSILRKKDGKMVGCAFVQFNEKAEALKAITECNMKPLLGRLIAVDLAVEKEKFMPYKTSTEISMDVDKVKEIKVKEEVLSYDEKEDSDEEDDDIKTEIKEEKESSNELSDSELDDGDESYSSKSEDDDDDEEEPMPVKAKFPAAQGPSKDITEERTLFLKNLPFAATDEDIAEVLRKFGELKYVLLCIDQLTEHPRGTAFAQFKEREAADACLAAATNPAAKNEFILYGRPMHIMRAISRMELERKKSEKDLEKITKDKRNLYLAREGCKKTLPLMFTDNILYIGSMKYRKIRVICLTSVYPNWYKQLHAIFSKHAPDGAKITEARIMRDFRNLNENGIPKSRGYGFVTFTEHEHALAALRKINNNPDIFTNDQRPIVEFSLENRSVLKARQKRMEKSKEKNPLWKKDRHNIKQDAIKIDKQTTSEIKKQPVKMSEVSEGESQPMFMGSKSDPCNKNLPVNYGPKIRHRERDIKGKTKISRKQFRKEQRDRALGRKRKRPEHEDRGESSSINPQEASEGQAKKKRKRNKKKISKKMKADIKDERAFNAIVQKYKAKISSVNSVSSKKWYED